MPSPFERVYALVARIPPGRIATYGQIARHLGMPNGARTVGWAMRACPDGLPWHRVVNSRGMSSLQGEGLAQQRDALARDGVDMDPSGRVDLERYRWREI